MNKQENLMERYEAKAKELDSLVEKWSKAGLLEGVDDRKKSMTAVVLENQAKVLTEATGSSAISTYNKLLLPLARRIVPNLIATDLFGVQPMLGPTSQVFSLQMATSAAVVVDFGSPAGSAAAKADFDTRAAKSNNSGQTGGLAAVTGVVGDFVAGAGTDLQNVGVLGTFTGGAGNFVQFPAGTEIGYLNLLQISGKNDTATLENGIYVSDTGGIISEIEAKVATATVTASTRKLRAKWSFEAAQDASNLHGIDLQEELVSALATEVRREIDIELIDNARNAAAVYAVELDDGAGGGIAGSNTWQAEKYRALYQQIVFAAQQIAINTRRGAANWMVTSPKMIAALSSLSNFTFNQVDSKLDYFADGAVTHVGTLDGRIKVYSNPMAFNDNILLGFKGSSVLDCGQVYAPYVPLMISDTIIDPGTMQPRVGVMTRYGVVGPDQILSGGSYYADVQLANTATGSSGILDI